MKIPYGNANFAEIRRKGMFYVDKTPFLPELEADEYGYKNLVFLRPRRFGKSLLVSLLEHYYDISLGSHFDELFRGLWVYDHPTPEKNKYLVLSLNFSTVAGDGGETTVRSSFLVSVRSSLTTLLQRYKGRHAMLDRFADDIRSYTDAAELLNDFLGIVGGTEDQVYVLVDEYDTFTNALLSADLRDVYSKMTDKTGFVRTFYRVLKAGSDRGSIARVFITGATPILLDDLMTGFNISTNISNRRRFNALAGFTRTDVERAVDELLVSHRDLADIEGIGDRTELLDVLERFYDGYRFSEDAEERVFNSTLVLYFLRELLVHGKYPKQMLDKNARTDYKKLHSLWATVGPVAEERREALETVLDEGFVWSDLVEEFGHKTATTTSQFVSLMYYTGMLTLSPEPPRGTHFRFEVPNRVIRDLGWEHFVSLLGELDGIELRSNAMSAAIYTMAESGNIEPFLDVVRKDVLTVLSLKDLPKYNEKSMKMLLIGTILMTQIFHILSEKEFAKGYNDLFLSPLANVPNAKYAWMIELKYITAADRDRLDKVVEQAETQLRKYLSDQHLVPMLTRGLELRVGTLVFVGCKEVEWRPYT